MCARKHVRVHVHATNSQSLNHRRITLTCVCLCACTACVAHELSALVRLLISKCKLVQFQPGTCVVICVCECVCLSLSRALSLALALALALSLSLSALMSHSSPCAAYWQYYVPVLLYVHLRAHQFIHADVAAVCRDRRVIM